MSTRFRKVRKFSGFRDLSGSRRSRFTLLPAMVLSLALAGWAPAAPAGPSGPLLGFSEVRATEQRALEARFDASLNAANLREWMKRLTAHPHHLGSPYGKANAEFMAGLFRSWGFETKLEEFQGALPHAQGARPGDGGADGLHGPARRARPAGGLDLRPDGRAAPRLQRLLDRRRRHGRAGLRQLRRPRRLRRAGAARHRRQGQDRHRPLRRLLARHQAQGGRRARRHRLHHLLRPARGRLLPGRRLPQGRLALRVERPARLRGRHAALPRRPADPRRGRHRERQAAGYQRRDHPHQDPRAPHLLRRRAPAAAAARRARWRRTAGAAPCPFPTASAPGRPRSTSSWNSTGSWCPPTTSSPCCRAPSGRISGSSAATTTTPGSTAPPTP